MAAWATGMASDAPVNRVRGVVRRRIVGFKAEEVPGNKAFIEGLF